MEIRAHLCITDSSSLVPVLSNKKRVLVTKVEGPESWRRTETWPDL